MMVRLHRYIFTNKHRLPRKILWVLICLSLLTSVLYMVTVLQSLHSGHPPDFPNKSQLLVAVVEEHHEALWHWIKAANKGIIPKYGNTLVHIDGHSDDAPPYWLPEYPEFRWPHNYSEVRLMLQENDIFILAAAMMGLVDRYIWIWPKWDAPNHNGTQYLNYTGYLGTTKDTANKQFCECMWVNEKFSCIVDNRDGEPTNSSDIPSDIRVLSSPSMCDIKTSYRIEKLSADTATDILKSGEFIHPRENVILDIDEDFFGCESGTDILFKEGISWPTVETMSTLVGYVYCPTSTKLEGLADSVIAGALLSIVASRSNCSLVANVSCTRTVRNKVRDMLLEHAWTVSGLFCNDVQKQRAPLILLATSLAQLFMQLSDKQIFAIIEVGFCRITTPKTLEMFANYDGQVFRLCHGTNFPNNTAVLLHSPHPREVEVRMRKLEAIVSLVKKPKMVTVCRSVRDGYTPRNYFHRIESGILNAISQFTEFIDIEYDQDLLGGTDGWPYRYSN